MIKAIWTYYFALTLIVIASFLLFSTVFYPFLNSDDALSVLMLHYFNFPNDLYCWGQDRGGSLIPLLGQPFKYLLGLSSIWAESLVHHLILVIGFCGFSTLFKSFETKLLFSLAWFLPLIHFIGITRYSFGLHYALIGVIIWLVNRFYTSEKNSNRTRIIWMIVLCSFISLWVMDSAITTLLIIAISFFFFNIKKGKSVIHILTNKYHLILVFGTVLSFLVIFLMKRNSWTPEHYQYSGVLFNDFNGILTSIQIMFLSVWEILSFQSLDWLASVYSWSGACSIILVFILWKKNSTKTGDNKLWIQIFSFEFFAVIALVIVSEWALRNGVARRYFSGSYISIWLVGLMIYEEFPGSVMKKITGVILCVTLVVGSVSSLYHYKFINPKTLVPKSQIIEELNVLGKSGFIGNYWNSYVFMASNPDMIKATPHDKSEVRNLALVDSVFQQPSLYVVMDNWLDSFPDTLIQFDRTLIKKGSSLELAGCVMHQYEIEKMP